MAETNYCFFGTSKDNNKVIWEITDNCQQECYHCCNHVRRTHKEIKLKEVNKILNELELNNVTKIVITGGEPFLHKNIYEILDNCIERNFEISICSNGMLIEKNITELQNRKIKKIIISLDTLDECLYKKLRGSHTSLNSVLRGIDCLKSMTNIKVSIHCVINKLNINEISDIYAFACEKNLEFTVSNLIANPTDKIYQLVCSKELIINKIKNMAIEVNKKECVCCAGDTISGITTSGKFTPCLWISNYTNKYDMTSFNKMKENFKHYNKLSNLCTAMNITENKQLNNAITIRLR